VQLYKSKLQALVGEIDLNEYSIEVQGQWQFFLLSLAEVLSYHDYEQFADGNYPITELWQKDAVTDTIEFKSRILIIEHIKSKIAELESRTPKEKKLTYHWQGKPEELNNLFTALVKGGFIDKATNKIDFLKVFSGVPLTEVTSIRWIRAKNLLAYFLDELLDQGKIPVTTPLWNVAKSCFVEPGSLKQQKNKYLSTNIGKPKQYELIDSLLQGLT
jgi:hypothetical protein